MDEREGERHHRHPTPVGITGTVFPLVTLCGIRTCPSFSCVLHSLSHELTPAHFPLLLLVLPLLLLLTTTIRWQRLAMLPGIINNHHHHRQQQKATATTHCFSVNHPSNRGLLVVAKVNLQFRHIRDGIFRPCSQNTRRGVFGDVQTIKMSCGTWYSAWK